MKLKRRRRKRRRTNLARSVIPQPGRSHSPAPAPRSCLHHSHSLSLHPAPPLRILRRPASPPPRVGKAISSSYLLPSCSASPFLLHKITEAEERSVADVVSSLPVQLFYPTIALRRAQLVAPLLLHPIGAFCLSPVPMASSLWRAEP